MNRAQRAGCWQSITICLSRAAHPKAAAYRACQRPQPRLFQTPTDPTPAASEVPHGPRR